MYGTLQYLLLAMTVFVVGHFVLAGIPVRRSLIRLLGETGFRFLFSVFAVAGLVWIIHAFAIAPREALWPTLPALRWVPVLVMPFACILLVAGVTTRSATMVGGEKLPAAGAPATGILTVTRHPFLWAIVLWSLAHVPPNGDWPSLVLFIGFAVLAFGGMVHIDRRRAAELGAAWGPVVLTTSVVPFVAALQGRTRIDWTGIGWPRALGGIALYVALAVGHQWLIGVPVMPIPAS